MCACMFANSISTLRKSIRCPTHVFDTTHMPIPAQTNAMPNHVSLLMILPSTYQSPKTVKRKASEFVIGTVSESSALGKAKGKQSEEIEPTLTQPERSRGAGTWPIEHEGTTSPATRDVCKRCGHQNIPATEDF